MDNKKLKPKINWEYTIFFIMLPIVAISGLIALIASGKVVAATVYFAIGYTILNGLAITAGYHRLFSHGSYKTNAFIRLIFCLIGAATFEGSVLEWSTDHRNHHRYTDTERDPYNIKRGFWYAHIGWIFTLDPKARDFNNVADLTADPIVRFQHRHYLLLAVLMGFVAPMLIAALWGDWLGGLVIAGAVRMTLVQHFTFFINSACHCFGTLTYSDRNSARDNWFLALFTFGEGYHNFHHRFPLDYRNGIRFFHFDPTKWLIRTLAAFGLASDLKRIEMQRIVRNKIDEDKQRLSKIIAAKSDAAWQPIYQALISALSKLDEIEKSYSELKSSKLEYMQDRISEYKNRIRKYREQLSQARSELNYWMKLWTKVTAENLVS